MLNGGLTKDGSWCTTNNETAKLSVVIIKSHSIWAHCSVCEVSPYNVDLSFEITTYDPILMLLIGIIKVNCIRYFLAASIWIYSFSSLHRLKQMTSTTMMMRTRTGLLHKCDPFQIYRFKKYLKNIFYFSLHKWNFYQWTSSIFIQILMIGGGGILDKKEINSFNNTKKPKLNDMFNGFFFFRIEHYLTWKTFNLLAGFENTH